MSSVVGDPIRTSQKLNNDRSFIRLHLGYSDVIYDQPVNEPFSCKIESVHYNASLAIT